MRSPLAVDPVTRATPASADFGASRFGGSVRPEATRRATRRYPAIIAEEIASALRARLSPQELSGIRHVPESIEERQPMPMWMRIGKFFDESDPRVQECFAPLWHGRWGED
jgi:hypothetical protein